MPFQKGNKIWKGRKHTEETKKKISKSRIGKPNPMLGKYHSKETKEKMSEMRKGEKGAWFGKHLPEEIRNKISKALKGKKRPPFSKEWREKIGKAEEGEKHYNWQGGKSFEPYSIDWTETLKRAIRERDRYLCKLCFSYGNNVHHIDYDKKNNNPNNLITLCRVCHTKTNHNRKYWKQYFQKL